MLKNSSSVGGSWGWLGYGHRPTDCKRNAVVGRNPGGLCYASRPFLPVATYRMSTAHPIRNIAIIAHVDHGKTTLVDSLLKQSRHLPRERARRRSAIMDSNDLERERGITILAKNIAVDYAGRHASTSSTPRATPTSAARSSACSAWPTACCCSSTPSRARCRRRASCSRKALELGLKPIVVVNKIDRPDARPARGARRGLRPVRRARRRRRAARLPDHLRLGPRRAGRRRDLRRRPRDRTCRPLFETDPRARAARRRSTPRRRCRCSIATLDYNDYVGRIGIGRVFAGTIKRGPARSP